MSSKKPLPFSIGSIKQSFGKPIGRGERYTPKQVELIASVMKKNIDPETGYVRRGFGLALKKHLGVSHVAMVKIGLEKKVLAEA